MGRGSRIRDTVASAESPVLEPLHAAECLRFTVDLLISAAGRYNRRAFPLPIESGARLGAV